MKRVIFEVVVFFIAAAMFAVGVNTDGGERIFSFFVSFVALVYCFISNSCNKAVTIPNGKGI